MPPLGGGVRWPLRQQQWQWDRIAVAMVAYFQGGSCHSRPACTISEKRQSHGRMPSGLRTRSLQRWPTCMTACPRSCTVTLSLVRGG